MSSRGLPGFLRRTRRSDFDENTDDDDDDEEEEAIGYRHQHSNGRSANTATDELTVNGEQVEAPKNAATNAAHLERNGSLESESSSNPKEVVKRQVSITISETAEGNTPNAANSNTNTDDSSISTLGASTNTMQASFSASKPRLDRKMSYRESQFSKILGDDLVKLSDLRKLSWNGIPVRSQDGPESLQTATFSYKYRC